MKTRKFSKFTLLVLSTLLLLAFRSGKAWPTVAQLQLAPAARTLNQTQHSISTSNTTGEMLSPSSILFSYQGQLLDANGNPINGRVEMTFRLYHQETSGTPFWTETYTGVQAISVANGLFHTLLGSITPINAADLSGDIYLELAVNGETLSPRELLTSVAYAVEAVTLPDGATTRGALTVGGDLTLTGDIYSGNDPNLVITNGYGNLRLRATSSLLFFIDTDNNQTDAVFRVLKNQDSLISPVAEVFQVAESGNINAHGALDMNGNNIVDVHTLNVLGNNLYMGSISNGNVVLRRDGRELHLLPWGGSSYNFDRVCIGCGASASFVVNGSTSIRSNLGVDGYIALSTASTDWARIEGHGKGTADDGGMDFNLGDDSGVNFRWNVNGQERMRLSGPGDLTVSGNMSLSDGAVIRWADNGQLQSHDNNHRIVFDRVNNALEIREYGEIYLHAGGDDGGDADLTITDSQINVNGNSIVNCGAFVEANLQTEEELAAIRIDRFEEGDVLCWGIDRLELCSSANDRLVQAVADTQGRPIVLGAETVKVLGPVMRGDILVASDVPGYAMVNNDPRPGSVIAQALEGFDGERGVVKAMIRKF